MKHFTRTVLIFAAVFLVLGIVFSIAGWSFGYLPGSYLDEFEHRVEAQKKEAKQMEKQEFDGVSALKLSVGAAVCTVSAYSGDRVRIEVSDPENLKCRQSGKLLKVEYGSQKHSLLEWVKQGQQGEVAVLQIYVPQSLTLQELEIEGGASEINAEGITCEELEIECGAGKTSFVGAIEKRGTAECGAGSIHMTLLGKKKDFDYSLECGLGSISVKDGPMLAGVGEDREKNEGGKKLELECGLGSIQVDFQEDM